MSDQAVTEPRPWLAPLDRRFLLAGLALTVLAGTPLGALNIALAHGWMRPPAQSNVQAHAHAQVFGFVLLFVVGFGYQLLPRMLRRPLPFPRLARASFWLLVSGATLHILGQTMGPLWPGRALLGASGAALALGALAFAVNVFAITQAVYTREGHHRFLRVGAALFASAALFDAALATEAGFGAGAGLYPLAPARALWTLAVHGGAVAFAIGVAARLLPSMFGTGKVRALVLQGSLAALALGAPLQALALSLQGGETGFLLELSARALVGVGLLLAAFGFRWTSPYRAPPVLADAFFPSMIRLALGSLMAAGALRLGTSVAELAGLAIDNLVHDAERHLVTVGFLTVLIVAMATKLVPALSGRPLRLAWLRWAVGALLFAAVLGRSAQALSLQLQEAFRLSALSGTLALAALLLFAAMLIATLRGPAPVAAPRQVDPARLAAARARMLGLSADAES